MAHPGNGDVNFNCYESVNQRVLAGNNTQLATGGDGNFRSKVDAQWSSSAFDGKGGVVVKGTSTEAYSFWYACRQMLKGYLYMAVHCCGFDKNILKVEASDVVELSYKQNEEFSYTVQKDGVLKLNDRIVLPEGIEFENSVLSGKFANVGLYRIDIIATGQSKSAVRLIINVVPDEAEYNENLMEKYADDSKGGKKGCFGDVSAFGTLAGVIALAGIASIIFAIDKKRRA